MDFNQSVFRVTQKVPRGCVSTYSAIARAIRNPGAARAVGNALNKNRSREIPCHRVIRSDGLVGGYAGGTKNKIKILRREGIKINKFGVMVN